MCRYYIYRHIRHDKNEPFYIGKGTKADNCVTHKVVYRRAYSKLDRNYIWKGITNRTDYTVEIIYETDSRKEIDKKEIEFIQLYGRIDKGTGTLCNLTDGGDGQYNVSDEALRRGVEKRKASGSYKKVGDLNARPCHLYSNDGMYVRSFRSKKDAARELDIEITTLFLCIKNKRMCYGVYFSNEKVDVLNLSEYSKTAFVRKKNLMNEMV